MCHSRHHHLLGLLVDPEPRQVGPSDFGRFQVQQHVYVVGNVVKASKTASTPSLTPTSSAPTPDDVFTEESPMSQKPKKQKVAESQLGGGGSKSVTPEAGSRKTPSNGGGALTTAKKGASKSPKGGSIQKVQIGSLGIFTPSQGQTGEGNNLILN